LLLGLANAPIIDRGNVDTWPTADLRGIVEFQSRLLGNALALFV
jgi:hypothetical protein